MVKSEIIPITEAHAEGFNKAVDFVARERKYLSFFEGFSRDGSLAFIHKNISEGNPHFVVVDHGQVVGWCDITRVIAAAVRMSVRWVLACSRPIAVGGWASL
jgi:hypothetical protein